MKKRLQKLIKEAIDEIFGKDEKHVDKNVRNVRTVIKEKDNRE